MGMAEGQENLERTNRGVEWLNDARSRITQRLRVMAGAVFAYVRDGLHSVNSLQTWESVQKAPALTESTTEATILQITADGQHRGPRA